MSRWCSQERFASFVWIDSLGKGLLFILFAPAHTEAAVNTILDKKTEDHES